MKQFNRPFNDISVTVEDHRLIMFIEAEQIEETVRFAYNLHLSLLSVVHTIYVQKGSENFASFVVHKPNHGENYGNCTA